jgi:hypothetical protein
MRTPFLGLVLLLSIGFAATAFAQKRDLRSFEGNNTSRSMSEEELAAARRKAAGIKDVSEFGKSKEPPPKPFPWGSVLLGGLILGILAPVGYKVAVSTKQDLEDQASFGLSKEGRSAAKEGAEKKPQVATDLASLSRRPASRRAGGGKNAAAAAEKSEEPAEDDGRTPRDRVWDAITTGGNWVTADWVASTAGLSAPETIDELGALVAEGYLQERKDSAGRPVFRAVS